MAKEILWSKPAEEDFRDLLEYLSTNWNNNIAKQFIKILEINLARIIYNPDLFPIILLARICNPCPNLYPARVVLYPARILSRITKRPLGKR